MDNHVSTILVIDDEPAIRESFCDYLGDRGYEVMAAENGKTGLAMLRDKRPDLVLVDLRMPELDGLEVLKQGREIAPDIPKVVVSGVNRIKDVVQSLRYGAWDYLIKPVKDLSMLLHTVEKSLEKARLLRENQSYQRHLEEMVAHRTRELEQANINLSSINDRLKKIVESTKGLSACMATNRFGSQILHEFARHMAASGGSLYLAEEKGLRLIHTLDPGHAPDLIPFPLEKQSILAKVMESGKPLFVKDLARVEALVPSGWDGYQDKSLLAFPIRDSQGKTAGIITLHSKKTPPFVEQDKEIGSILASYCCESLRAVQAFEALKKSETQYRTLFEKTNDAIFMEARNTGRYLDANQAAAQLTGRTRQELVTLTGQDIMPRSDRTDLTLPASFSRLDKLGAVVIKRPDSSFRVAKMSTVALDDACLFRIARDITHDLEVETQLRQSQKMEALGTLAGGIAHDFNNILSSIFGYADLLRINLVNPEAAGKNLDQIIKGAQRATELVQQILTFSRQAEHKKIHLKISLVIKEALKFLRSSIPATIAIKDNIGSQAMIVADPTQIHQVVMNLCTNAYHAMLKTGGEMTVGLENVEISRPVQATGATISPGTYVCFKVRDTGHGMTPDILDKIFDPYFSTKQPGKGTGLGLAMVSGIVEKHKGFIKVSSIPGQGSVFKIYFPVVGQIKAADIPITEPDVPQGMSKTILLVDDEPDILNPFSRFLEKFGYEVHAFENGLDALRAFQKAPHGFDLVITDMFMPGMTGEALSVKAMEIRPDIPIILCTGYADRFDEATAMKLGIRKYVQKPIMIRQLNDLIIEVLGNEVITRP